MNDVHVDVIELAGIIGYQTGQLDGLAGNTYGSRIPQVRKDVAEIIKGLNPFMLSNFWIAFDREYETGWNRGTEERERSIETSH